MVKHCHLSLTPTTDTVLLIFIRHDAGPCLGQFGCSPTGVCGFVPSPVRPSVTLATYDPLSPTRCNVSCLLRMWVWFRLTTLGFIGGCDPEQGPVFSPAKDSITQIQSESDVLSYFEKSDPGLSVFL